MGKKEQMVLPKAWATRAQRRLTAPAPRGGGGCMSLESSPVDSGVVMQMRFQVLPVHASFLREDIEG
jgi:hypothetical protein